MSVDTTTEAVERLAATLKARPSRVASDWEAAATLRALAAERDALREDYAHCFARLQGSYADRDAVRAEAARLREFIANIHNRVRHEFSAEVEAAADKAFKAMNGIAALAQKEAAHD